MTYNKQKYAVYKESSYKQCHKYLNLLWIAQLGGPSSLEKNKVKNLILYYPNILNVQCYIV